MVCIFHGEVTDQTKTSENARRSFENPFLSGVGIIVKFVEVVVKEQPHRILRGVPHFQSCGRRNSLQT